MHTMGHYFEKHNKGGASHQKEIEKSIESFERFLSLHKLTSSWHKERIRKGTKIGKLKFFITLELKQFCARKETKNKTSNTYCDTNECSFYHYYDSVFPLHFIVFISMKNSVSKILPSWFLFMAAPWRQMLNAVVNSEDWIRAISQDGVNQRPMWSVQQNNGMVEKI